jgi:hypothetical protein
MEIGVEAVDKDDGEDVFFLLHTAGAEGDSDFCQKDAIVSLVCLELGSVMA